MNPELKLNRFKKYIPYLIFLLLVIVALSIYKYTNLFKITNLDVFSTQTNPLKFVTSEQIKDIEYLKQTPKYFEFDSYKAQNEIKAISPFINNVFITKDFPNSALIYVTERVPFLTLEIDKKTCVLLDTSKYVLDKVETDCVEMTKKYNTIYIKTDNPKVEFNKGTQSNYYQEEQIEDTLKVMAEYKVSIQNIDIRDNISIFLTNKGVSYVISYNQDYKVQLSRFVGVLNELEKKSYKYKQIDLRFIRPVLTPR